MMKKIELDSTSPTSWAPYASVAVSTMGGLVIDGVPGAAVGFMAGLADEYFISTGDLLNHDLSRTAFHYCMTFQPWMNTLAQRFPEYTLLIHSLSLAFSGTFAYFSSDFLDFNNKIDMPVDSFLTINRIFDEKEILSHKEAARLYNKFLENPLGGLIALKEDAVVIYNNPFLFNFLANTALGLTQIGINTLYLKSMGPYAGSLFVTSLLSSHNVDQFLKEEFIIAASKIIAISSIKLGADVYSQIWQNSLSSEQNKMIVEATANLLLDNGNNRKILGINKEEGRVIINQLMNDLFILLEGSNKLNKVITETSQALASLSHLKNYVPDMILPYAIVSMIPKQYFLSHLLPQSQEIAKNKADSTMKTNNIIIDIIENSESLSLRDGEEFMKYKFNTQWSKLKELNLNATTIDKAKSYMYSIITIHNMFIDPLYFGFKWSTKQLDIADIPLIYSSSSAYVFYFLSSNLDSQANNIDIAFSKSRVDTLFKLIHSPNYHAERINNEAGNVIFKNYSLFLGEQKLVQIDNLIFEKGKHYAITGASGCGKSSTLNDLKDGVVGILSSTGEIHLPSNAKIMHLDQQLYIPKESTLLETIYFPGILEQLPAEKISNLKNFVIFLFRELEIDNFVNDPTLSEGLIANLDTQKFKLSGGQMQKISIIQAILNNPDIIIMDENFARLDNRSVELIQKAIRKYLEKPTFLIVDHKAHGHNYNSFYDTEVHFENSTIEIKQIAVTPSAIGTENNNNIKRIIDFLSNAFTEEHINPSMLQQAQQELSSIISEINNNDFIGNVHTDPSEA